MSANLKRYYMSVYSVAYSSCGSYLATANNYGDIAIFNLSPFFEYDDDQQIEIDHKKPLFMFQAHKDSVYCLASTKKFVISGSIGEIRGWKWSDLKGKEGRMSWTIIIPRGSDLTKPEANALAVSSKENESLLFAACGDNKVHCFDLESLALKFSLVGHTEYVHCLALGNGNPWECISGSEDGSVRIWDDRKDGKEVHIIEPYKHELCKRPQFGNWIGCVAFDEGDDWLVCGGAPALSLWHLRSLAPAVIFPKPDATDHVVRFHEESVISGGSEPCVNHWSFHGELTAEVPTSARCVFDIAINNMHKHQVLGACGNSYKIDMCKDFRFKDFTLLLA